MPSIVYILPDGSERALDIAEGDNLMQAAVTAGLPGIIGECGGSAMCATCHVYLEADLNGVFGEVSPIEDGMLDSAASAREAHSRLSCQLVVTGGCEGVRVRLPPTQV